MEITLKSIMIALAAAFAAAVMPASPVLAEQACVTKSFEAGVYVVCAVPATSPNLRLFWKSGEGKPYRSFSAVAEAVANEGKVLRFAVNAGMYLEDFSPVGLYVEGGQELRPLNIADAKGAVGPVPNFYKNRTAFSSSTRLAAAFCRQMNS